MASRGSVQTSTTIHGSRIAGAPGMASVRAKTFLVGPIGVGIILASGATGCGARTLLDEDACSSAVLEASNLECVRPGDDACAAPIAVAPVCDPSSKGAVCPAGARPLVRAESEGDCLPFSDPAGGIDRLGGTLVRVPTDDGRCLWIGEDVRTAAGDSLRNVAFETDPGLPFGACPTEARFGPQGLASVVEMEGGADPSLLVQIASAFRRGGETRVVYRLFQFDADAPFGVANLGSGIGRWDGATQRIVVGSPGDLDFSVDWNIGDAALIWDGQTHVYGCAFNDGLTNECLVMRSKNAADWKLFSDAETWVDPIDPIQAEPVFASGPWVSSVTASESKLTHVYSIGFGRTIETSIASRPEGPWTSGPTLGVCDLPADDEAAFCAGPVVHEERADPTAPGEAWITYGIGTTALDQAARIAANPRAYWTRLSRVALP
jgi:hypothetical protein